MLARLAGAPLAFVGVALVTTGIALMHVPTAIIAAGLGIIYVAWRVQVAVDTRGGE